MNSTVYKCCAVPLCVNTSIKTPNKLFVNVPRNKTMRNKWLILARRDPTALSLNSPIHFCEDHFELPNDMDNFMEYHVMGSVSQVRMKPGCIPTKFECQPDRRTRTSNKERPYILKKQRKILIEECINDLEERSITTKHLDLGDPSSGSSEHKTKQLIDGNQEIPNFYTQIQTIKKCRDHQSSYETKCRLQCLYTRDVIYSDWCSTYLGELLYFVVLL